MAFLASTVETPAADEICVDVLQAPPDPSKPRRETRPGTQRYFRDGAEVFNFTDAETLQLMREGWTLR